MIATPAVRGLLAGLIFSAVWVGTCYAQASDAVWKSLAEGGKVVLMRHAAVNSGRGRGNALLRDPSCKKERNLSSVGERDARYLGKQFQERNIPISKVRHSPFCRTADTARTHIQFGKLKVKP